MAGQDLEALAARIEALTEQLVDVNAQRRAARAALAARSTGGSFRETMAEITATLGQIEAKSAIYRGERPALVLIHGEVTDDVN